MLPPLTPQPPRTFWRSRLFWSLSIGLFLSAYVYGLAAVSLAWVPHYGRETPTLLLLWPALSLASGMASGGWLADLLGRRALLRWSPIGYMAGSILLTVGLGLIPMLAGILILLVTAGIDGNTLLTYAQELPTSTRPQALWVELNFLNLGGVALAALALVGTRLGPTALREVITVIPLSLSLVLWVLRGSLAESLLWQHSQQHTRIPAFPRGSALRFASAAAFATANTAGFSLLSYAFGAEFLPHHFHHILIVSTSAAFLVGLIAHRLSRLPTRPTLLTSYGLAVGAALMLRLVRDPAHPAFWPILFSLGVFGSLAYASEDILTANHWPARTRARTLAATRILGLMVYALVVWWARATPLNAFLTAIVGAWSLGLVAAVAW